MISFRSIGAVTKNSGSGNVTSVTLAPGHVVNDFLLLFIASADNVVCSVTGWTNKIAVNSSTNTRLEVWYKVDDGAISAPTITHAAGNSCLGVIAAYTGVSLTNPFRDSQTQTTTASLTTTAPIINWVAGDMRIFVGAAGTTSDTGGAATNNWATVTSFTERADVQNTSGLGAALLGVDERLSTVVPIAVTSAITWGGSTTPNNVGAQIALIPTKNYYTINNYQTFSAGDGISVSEKIR